MTQRKITQQAIGTVPEVAVSGISSHVPAGQGESERLRPAQLLGQMRQLGDSTSAAARGYWLPLLLFGALICGSLPFYERLRPARIQQVRPPMPSHCVVNQPCHITAGASPLVHAQVAAIGFYWQVALVAGVVATAGWYRWQGNRVGLRTPARAFLITGLVLGELVLLVPLLIGQSASLTTVRLMHDTHQAGPLVIIAVLLWVLAWAQRSRALAIITGCFLLAALAVSPFTDGGVAGGSTGAADLSLDALRAIGAVPALILLAAGTAIWLTTRQAPEPGGEREH
jgi:hypothetical protein